MKNKIKSMLLACTMTVSCLPFSWISANAATPDYSLWDKFIKYDLCITDYDSLTDTEKDLCHFIFDTERSADDTIICERARKQLAGYDTGERITLNQAEDFYDIQDSNFIDGYLPYTLYSNYSDNNVVLRLTPDIIHLDWDNNSAEYWFDDEGKERVFTSIETSEDAESIYNNYYIYKKYDDTENVIEEKEIPRNIDNIKTIKHDGCIYQVYPDNTLHLSELADKSAVSVKIPEIINNMPVVSIKAYAFKDSELTDVVLPNTLEYIGAFAFMNCSKLKTVNFPKGLEFIGTGAFERSVSLGDITINCPNLQVGKLVFNEACAENVTVNIKSVPSDIMYSFAKFKSFTIGSNVKEVGFHFLESDRELNKNIVIPENVKIISSEGGHFPFSSVTVPASIEVFGAYDKASGNCMTDIEHSAKIPLLENKCIFDQDCTINGWYGTEAHSYAIEWGLKFNPLDENIAYGDLNADNSIDIADAVLMYSYILGHEVTVGFEADLTKDGIIDAFDMAAMRRNLIAILHTFT